MPSRRLDRPIRFWIAQAILNESSTDVRYVWPESLTIDAWANIDDGGSNWSPQDPSEIFDVTYVLNFQVRYNIDLATIPLRLTGIQIKGSRFGLPLNQDDFRGLGLPAYGDLWQVFERTILEENDRNRYIGFRANRLNRPISV